MNHWRTKEFVQNRLVEIGRQIRSLENQIEQTERDYAELVGTRAELAEFRQIQAALTALVAGASDDE